MQNLRRAALGGLMTCCFVGGLLGRVPAFAWSYGTSAYLPANQQAQTTSYYCGPAAVAEALGERAVSVTQSRAAYLLNTTTDGTAWYGVHARVPNSGLRPVVDVLNYEAGWGTGPYAAVSLPISPTAAQVATF